ncbi:class E sortase [Streptomyces sp. NPDC019539]|uniref:class E sortase n=1 Tax=Streptomyces sp. NPDC019539 TaxID=3365063 RepID=UPI0037B9038E
MRERMPRRGAGRIPVVVQGRRTRAGRAGAGPGLARVLWAGAEIAVTLGVVVLLLVVHQLWWTNRQAEGGAARQVEALEREWQARAPGPDAGADAADGGTDPADGSAGSAPAPGTRRGGAGDAAQRWDRAYAVLRIPRLGVVAPVARGVAKRGVLDKGYVGHYPRTAQPGQPGNFAVAGHRNTHGEPFRYINRLRKGDRIEVETRTGVFTYVVDQQLPQTAAHDGGVIAAVPRSAVRPGYGYGEPGHYMTLTTCTPEYTSRYRLVVWGKLAAVRPR